MKSISWKSALMMVAAAIIIVFFLNQVGVFYGSNGKNGTEVFYGYRMDKIVSIGAVADENGVEIFSCDFGNKYITHVDC